MNKATVSNKIKKAQKKSDTVTLTYMDGQDKKSGTYVTWNGPLVVVEVGEELKEIAVTHITAVA